jgi:uncharacterized protein (DUF983 family)
MCKEKTAGHSLAGSVLSNKCPRCREGKLFTSANPYDLRTTMRMPEHCAVCGQPFELQTGFYFGTGYVSYGLSVLATIVSFLLWFFTIGISVSDDRLFWWLGINAVLLIILQPVLQRLSRSIWIAFFVYYDPSWSKGRIIL